MAGLLFVSQAMLDSWAEQGKIDFVGNVMTLLAGDGRGRSYALDPAVRFLSVVGAEADPNQLLRKVKSLAQLKELGAEAVDTSVILGDVAYEVEPGFLAEMSALQAAAAARAERPAAAPAATPAGAPPAPAVTAAAPVVLGVDAGLQPGPAILDHRPDVDEPGAGLGGRQDVLLVVVAPLQHLHGLV
ncbi:MAG TPA: hypothetical protein VFP50_00445, partial [Anaeromyxobacteraceae bacterium]|nr:hypothetical protein [Anaeromyxobacteraceae bacterium]